MLRTITVRVVAPAVLALAAVGSILPAGGTAASTPVRAPATYYHG